jgi:chemotaxis protein MotB
MAGKKENFEKPQPKPKEKSEPVEEEQQGAPDWMLTFSDCMTLLLTFFVLLLSFSTFEDHTLPKLATSFAKSMPAVGLNFTSKKESVFERQERKELERIEKGAETPTKEPSDSEAFMKEKKPLDFRNLKVFSAPSERMFLGQGVLLSPNGKQLCDALGDVMKNVSARVVVSENGTDGNDRLGISRAIAIVEYLSNNKDIDSGRFNISSDTTMQKGPMFGRRVEITLLEKSVYK